MKKLLVLLLLGVVWAGKAEAANPTRGAKGVINTGYSVQMATVSTTAAVVYGVIITSGQPNVEYVVLFDTGTSVGQSATTRGTAFRTSCGATSTSTVTQCNYDPPLQFNTGIVAAQATALSNSLIIYEKGRVTQGY
jgi:hypothetical protein